MYNYNALTVINDANYTDHLAPALPDGSMASRGLVPRDFKTHPTGYLAAAQPYPEDMIVPVEEWKDRLRDIKAMGGTRVSRWAHQQPIIDQDGFGYCWAHSTTGAVSVVRVASGEPYVALSAFAVAATIKNGRDEGGWNAESAEFAIQKGIPSQDLWPQGSANLRYGTPECWANAANHKLTLWWDGSDDPHKAYIQSVSAFLLGLGVPVTDYNWWSHSVFTADFEEGTDSQFPLDPILKNSWKGWGDNGCGKLQGSRRFINGLTIARFTSPSM